MGSAIPGHPNASSLGLEHDPNDDSDAAAVSAWLAHADFYHDNFPQILLWDSLPELVSLAAQPADSLARVSNAMRRHNLEQGAALRARWRTLLEAVLTP
mgnify:CR=1 FL=1